MVKNSVHPSVCPSDVHSDTTTEPTVDILIPRKNDCHLLPLSLRIFLNWFLFSLLAVLDHRLLSPSPDHLLPYLSKLQTVLFNVQHPTFGINSSVFP